MLKNAYDEEYLPRASVFEWHKRFKEEWKIRLSISETEEFVPEKKGL
jgi:hypothetical protein